MINAIINGIFKLILLLANTLMSPIISAVTVLFPAVDTYFGYINVFLGYALTYVGTILDLFLVPRSSLVLLLDYFLICYSIYLIAITLKFAINIYNTLR